MARVDPERVLAYMRFIDPGDAERSEALMIQEAAEKYLAGAGVEPAKGIKATDKRYVLAVCALTLHWYDHRELVSDLNNPTVIPMGARVLIDQLKADALVKAQEAAT